MPIKDIGEIPTESQPTGRQIKGGLGYNVSAIFNQYLAISQKRRKIGTVTVEV